MPLFENDCYFFNGRGTKERQADCHFRDLSDREMPLFENDCLLFFTVEAPRSVKQTAISGIWWTGWEMPLFANDCLFFNCRGTKERQADCYFRELSDREMPLRLSLLWQANGEAQRFA
jgi:hypothetical protein